MMLGQDCRLDEVSGVVVGRRSLRGNIDAMNRLLIMAAIAALIFLPAAAHGRNGLAMAR